MRKNGILILVMLCFVHSTLFQTTSTQAHEQPGFALQKRTQKAPVRAAATQAVPKPSFSFQTWANWYSWPYLLLPSREQLYNSLATAAVLAGGLGTAYAYWKQQQLEEKQEKEQQKGNENPLYSLPPLPPLQALTPEKLKERNRSKIMNAHDLKNPINMAKADLSGFNLSNLNLANSIFSGANLAGADLNSAVLNEGLS